MSAETPRRTRTQTATSSGPAVITPQQVNDRSIIDSVAGFINEVVPAAYSTPTDTKDQLQWVHFEHLEKNQLTYPDGVDENGIPAPLIVVLGYGTGIQVWAVPINGEASEVLSWRHGSVRVLRILPNPQCNTCNDKIDLFTDKRPLMVLCDTAAPGPQYYSLSFISLKSGEQVKNIKFKNPVLNVLANKRSVVVTFAERIAIFDAHTLEDRLTVTTCYLSPGLYPNPVSLGTRWLAYAEKKLIPARRSGGGNEGEGVQSYTATVLHAAKSLGKGLRELGETVASSLAGTSTVSVQHVAPAVSTDLVQPGVVTILDLQNTENGSSDRGLPVESVIAHFTAHSEAIVCLQFDPSGMLLLTADKRGHDFHLFRIQPHPGGPSLAAVHHLYTLHRGDTSARVQDMCFSPDSRWIAVSTLRGTTHVFPITPYGGPVGMRTHATPHVVNRMSRFHRSAGLPVEGRSNSPVSQLEIPVQSGIPYRNPRLPPYPHSTVVHPLAQLRQQLNLPISGTGLTQRSGSGRTRLGSSSEDSMHVALRVAACFASPRAWLDTIGQSRDAGHKQRRPVESLFVISSHGTLIQYDLEPRHSTNISKERVCDDTPVELKVNAKAQWTLQRQATSGDIQAPLTMDNLLLCAIDGECENRLIKNDYCDDRWLSQVEIVTHAGPHRRLWMGPQFSFKMYNGNNGSPVSVLDTEATDIGIGSPLKPARSKPLNMPDDGVPVLIESGSASSFEQSPRLLDRDVPGTCGESQLKEDLADAMLESPGRARGENGGRCVLVSVKHNVHSVAKVVNPLGTVVTLPAEPTLSELEPEPEDAIIHENCDEALFRPVVGFTPQQPHIEQKVPQRSISSERYQGLQLDEIKHAPPSQSPPPVEEKLPQKPIGKKNRKSKSKLGVRINKSVADEVEIIHINERTPSPPCIIVSVRESDPEALPLPELEQKRLVPEEMWSSVEESSLHRMDSYIASIHVDSYNVEEISTLLDAELSPAEENVFNKTDEDSNVNNNGSQTETTESDDSTKNKLAVSCMDEPNVDDVADDSANLPVITTVPVQKTSKKKAKKKKK